ncbi:DUF262 domain-containing protein [Neolewinella agarilytica]|uniref:DUF262 domain-containing protein n=1 Tax=Neolewinella agarilytica TaxID=478744 RepID=UPI002354CFFF|nr:DUF262 domain-containing protein [Neolewinella agarilytica]
MSEDNNNQEEELNLEEQEDGEVYVTFDIATYPSDYTLYGIYQMWEEKDIEIPDFQREFVWNIKQASLLIESFLLGLPVPPVFFYIDDVNTNLVIDGQQRILSTVFFFSGYFGFETKRGRRQVFRLQGLNDKSPYANKTYEELGDTEQKKLRNTVLRAINIRQLSPTGESTSMYHIFERLNTGGTPLKSQEIRNVVFRGELVQILRKLNEDENWMKILGTKNPSKHQRDVELVLRNMAFYQGVSNYEKPMKEFLNKTMKANRRGDTKLVKEFSEKWPKATKFIIETFGEKPFHPRGRISTSAMDSIFSVITNNLGKLPMDIKERYDKLLVDDDFVRLTTLGTSDEANVKERYELTRKILLK